MSRKNVLTMHLIPGLCEQSVVTVHLLWVFYTWAAALCRAVLILYEPCQWPWERRGFTWRGLVCCRGKPALIPAFAHTRDLESQKYAQLRRLCLLDTITKINQWEKKKNSNVFFLEFVYFLHFSCRCRF